MKCKYMHPEKSQEDTATKLEPERVILSWKAPTKVVNRKPREFWVKLVAAATLLGFIFFIAEGVMPVILLISLLFLFYIMSSVEPESAQYSITTRGINISQQKNAWSLFTSFEILKRGEVNFLILNMRTFPGKIELIIENKDVAKIKSALSKYISLSENTHGGFDKTSDWISSKFS